MLFIPFLYLGFCHGQPNQECYSDKQLHLIFPTNGMLLKSVIPVQPSVYPFHAGPFLIQPSEFHGLPSYRQEDPPVLIQLDPENPLIIIFRMETIPCTIAAFIIPLIHQLYFFPRFTGVKYFPVKGIRKVRIPVLSGSFPVLPLVADIYDRDDPFPAS